MQIAAKHLFNYDEPLKEEKETNANTSLRQTPCSRAIMLQKTA